MISAIPRQARWVKIEAVIPAEVFPLWDTVCSKLEDEGVIHNHEIVRNGMVVEILVAEFLAGKH